MRMWESSFGRMEFMVGEEVDAERSKDSIVCYHLSVSDRELEHCGNQLISKNPNGRQHD